MKKWKDVIEKKVQDKLEENRKKREDIDEKVKQKNDQLAKEAAEKARLHALPWYSWYKVSSNSTQQNNDF